MAKLKKELDIIYKEEVNVLAPRNCQTVKFNFVTDKSSKMLGSTKDTFNNFFKVWINPTHFSIGADIIQDR